MEPTEMWICKRYLPMQILNASEHLGLRRDYICRTTQVEDAKKNQTKKTPVLTVNLVLQLDTGQELRSIAFSSPREVQKL